MSEPTRPRLLVVGAFPPPDHAVYGGIVTSCRLLLGSTLSEKAELTLIDSTQISNPPPGFALRLLLAARRSVRYLAEFERCRPDAVLLFTAAGFSVVEKGAMAWWARTRGVPALMFPRGGPVIDACRRSRFARSWIRIALRGARVVLCQGPAWQHFAVETLGLHPGDAPIVPNWTATPALLAIGRQRRFYRGERAIRLLFVGWVDREKGVLELLEACRQLASSRQFQLEIVGEGSASQAVRDAMASEELQSILRPRGWLSGTDLEAAFSEADVFVLPSWSEGLPNAMIEAMAARLAVVVSSVGAIPGVITDEQEALLVPPKDVAALRAALERVIDDAALRRRLGDAAFALAERQFGVESAADRILLAVADAVRKYGPVAATARSAHGDCPPSLPHPNRG